jgi:hypothetical protein
MPVAVFSFRRDRHIPASGFVTKVGVIFAPTAAFI